MTEPRFYVARMYERFYGEYKLYVIDRVSKRRTRKSWYGLTNAQDWVRLFNQKTYYPHRLNWDKLPDSILPEEYVQ